MADLGIITQRAVGDEHIAGVIFEIDGAVFVFFAVGDIENVGSQIFVEVGGFHEWGNRMVFACGED